MADFYFRNEELPSECNTEELQALLPEGCSLSIIRTGDNVLQQIIVHAPDESNRDTIGLLVKSHTPTKTDAETVSNQVDIGLMEAFDKLLNDSDFLTKLKRKLNE